MEPFGTRALVSATTAATVLAIRAVRKKTLTAAGAVVGFGVGFLSVATGWRGGALFYFYQIGSMATKYKKSLKAELDATVETATVRGAPQVLCVSAIAVSLSVWHAVACGAEQAVDFSSSSDDDDSDATSQQQQRLLASHLTCAILASHATCLADTLASEMGILARNGSPVLITQPWRHVPAGTNGGVTLNGLIWSAMGGLLIGLYYVGVDAWSGIRPPVHDDNNSNALAMILFATACGVIGSLLDSLVGAVLQATYYDADQKKVYHADTLKNSTSSSSLKHLCGVDILNNEQVNLVSVALATYLGGWVLGPWFFSQF